jgi:hypothetical protein
MRQAGAEPKLTSKSLFTITTMGNGRMLDMHAAFREEPRIINLEETMHLASKEVDFVAAHKLAFISVKDFVGMIKHLSFVMFLITKVGVVEGSSLGLAHQQAKAWGRSLLVLYMQRDVSLTLPQLTLMLILQCEESRQENGAEREAKEQ